MTPLPQHDQGKIISLGDRLLLSARLILTSNILINCCFNLSYWSDLMFVNCFAFNAKLKTSQKILNQTLIRTLKILLETPSQVISHSAP